MDANKRKNLVETIKLLRKHGVKSLKCAEFELELTHEPIKATRRKKSDDKEALEEGPSEEELLFWSANNLGAN